MKRKEFQKCGVCDKGVAHNRDLIFFRVSVERFVLDPGAIQQAQGLEMMLGGGNMGAALADIMGTDEDLAKPLGEKLTIFLCQGCAVEHSTPIAVLVEEIHEKKEMRRAT
jgi:hypothetical protein